MKKTILTSFIILLFSSVAFADDEQDSSTLIPPPPPTIQEQIQQSIENNPQEPTIRSPLPSDTSTAPVTIAPSNNPAPPDDYPTIDDSNKSTEPPPAIYNQPAE